MLILNYYTHLLLTNKYSIFFKLFIILIIYSLLHGNKMIYCMNENLCVVDIPEVAEAKEKVQPSNQVLALKNEIMEFAGTYADLITRINEQDKLILEQETKIEKLITDIEGPEGFFFSPLGYKGQIIELSTEIGELEEENLRLKQELMEAEGKAENNKL